MEKKQLNLFKGDLHDDNPISKKKIIAAEIIGLYNQVFERKILLTDYRSSLINARIKEGLKQVPPTGAAQFKAVFEFKKKEWTGTEQEKYLTIETLCAAKHFQAYLEAARLDFTKKKKQMSVNEPGYLPTPLFKK
jgi:uncharacterized phage protein (TIGR02220 family)